MGETINYKAQVYKEPPVMSEEVIGIEQYYSPDPLLCIITMDDNGDQFRHYWRDEEALKIINQKNIDDRDIKWAATLLVNEGRIAEATVSGTPAPVPVDAIIADEEIDL